MTNTGTTTGPTSVPPPQLRSKVTPVGKILGQLSLNIPPYQRPYTWTVKNIAQLLDDIQRFSERGQYRIGTFILYQPDGEATPQDRGTPDAKPDDIVDGQQRYLSFAIIAHALLARAADVHIPAMERIREGLQNLTIPQRRDGRSEPNLRANSEYVVQYMRNWDDAKLNTFADFFLDECTVVVLHVRDLDAAFQMFDSQNTRGRPLYPTDLLKAYHLRELSRTSPSPKLLLETVDTWEKVPPEEINHVIASILFRIKMWSVNRKVPDRGFTDKDIDLFKGIREDSTGNGRYRWAHPVLLAKAAVDRFRQDNQTLIRHGVVEELDFPFQITQPIIDGEMFFRMVDHYVHQSRRAGVHAGNERQEGDQRIERDPGLTGILAILDGLPKGTGYRYVRELFDALLIAYVDRFGWEDLRGPATRLARYAYLLRVQLQRVQISSVDMHARTGHRTISDTTRNPFADIAQALQPQDVLTGLLAQPPDTDAIPERLRDLYPSTTTSSNGSHREE